MKLRQLLNGVPLKGGNIDQEMEINSISYDSRTLEPGALFVALPEIRRMVTGTSTRLWREAPRPSCASGLRIGRVPGW